MCIKQALLLNELRSRLTTAGFPAIDFHIINTVNASEEYHKLADVSRDIPVYQEKDGEKIFEKFGAEKDHILVADKCNRLTYQVIMPWSILHYPYVKAAILSTYRDDPCGKCPIKHDVDSSEEESAEKPPSFNQTSKVDPDDSNESSEIEEVSTNFNFNLTDKNVSLSHDRNSTTTENFKKVEDLTNRTTTVPIVFDETTENFEIFENLENFENSTRSNATQNVTEESLEIPLSWSTTIDHSLLNSKNNYGNDIEHSLANLKNGSQVLLFRNNSEMLTENSTATNQTSTETPLINLNKTNEINDTYFNPYVTHRSPAIDEILDIEWKENNEKNMYWQKHKKYKKNKKDHLKKNEGKNLPSTTPVPIRIILRNNHKHPEEEDGDASEYIVLKTNDPNYHGHLDGKSYYYNEDNKISKGSSEETIIPRRIDFEGNTEKPVTDIYSIPWYDDFEPDPVFFNAENENEIENSTEEKNVGAEKEKNTPVPEKEDGKKMNENSKNRTDDQLVSHYSKLLYWVNYSI